MFCKVLTPAPFSKAPHYRLLVWVWIAPEKKWMHVLTSGYGSESVHGGLRSTSSFLRIVAEFWPVMYKLTYADWPPAWSNKTDPRMVLRGKL